MSFTIKQGDTSPALVADLLNPDRTPANLVGASVLFHMRDSRRLASPITKPAQVVDESGGRVKYEWDAVDTEDFGDFEAEFQVTYGDGTVETFPNDTYLEITIMEEIA